MRSKTEHAADRIDNIAASRSADLARSLREAIAPDPRAVRDADSPDDLLVTLME